MAKAQLGVDGVNVALDRCFFVGENSERGMTTFAYSFCIAIYGGQEYSRIAMICAISRKVYPLDYLVGRVCIPLFFSLRFRQRSDCRTVCEAKTHQIYRSKEEGISPIA